MSLTKRIEKLEQADGSNKRTVVARWEMDEDTQCLHCAGHEFTRKGGESLEEFVSRVATTVRATIHGNILWLSATSTI